jgi:hypothetical protein
VANYTLTKPHVFPDGTEVAAYRNQPDRAVIGSPVATASVLGGSATFTGLENGVRYEAIGAVEGEIRRYGFVPGSDATFYPRINSRQLADAIAAARAADKGVFDSRDSLAGDKPPDLLDALLTLGYAAPGDRGGTLYKRAGSEPLHAGKVQDANGDWWELVEDAHLKASYFGVSETRADNAPYLQDAIDYWSDRFGTERAAGSISLPRGPLTLQSGLVIDSLGLTLRGSSYNAQIFTGAGVQFGEYESVLIADHDEDAIRVKRPGVRLLDLGLKSSGSRADGMGVRIEPHDTASGRAHGCQVKRVKIVDQPSHGIAIIGMAPRSTIADCPIYTCGGHGIVVDRGQLSGRTNRPQGSGQITIEHCQPRGCGGHGIATGHPDEGAVPTYRLEVINCDIALNATDSDARYTTDQAYIVGGNHEFRQCAFGSADDPVATGGAYVAGRNIHLRNCRYIGLGSPGLTLDSPSSYAYSNRGFVLDGGLISGNTAPFDPFINRAASSVREARIEMPQTGSVTNFINTVPEASTVRYAGAVVT